MSFANNAINKKYTMTGADCAITVRASGKAPAYSGPLSQVDDHHILDEMISRGSNLVELKQTSPPPPPADNAGSSGSGKGTTKK